MAPKTPITPKTVPSRVLTVVEWKQCSSCQSTYHARDSHGSVCATIGSGQPFSVKNHGFVLDKQLYGKITDECTECPSFQMKIEKTNLVFLSPAVMQLCGIQIGAPVSVNSLGIKSSGSILNAWPCPHLQPTSIFVHNDVLKILFTDSNALRILPVTQKCTVAEEVVLKINAEKVSFAPEQLAAAFMTQYEGHTICKGTQLLLKFFGQKWAVTVQFIGTTSTPLGGDTDHITEALESLTVEDTPVTSVYALLLPTTRIHFSNLNGKSPESKVSAKVSLDDFGGSRDIIEEIMKMCTAVFDLNSRRTNVPRGMLLYGPPGTGKSLLIRAIANHFKVKLVTIIGPELFSKYYGETESRIRDKFDEALKSEPCIIFMDEVDALCPRRDGSSSHNDQERRVVATLLTMLDSIPAESRIIVMGASNRPDALDPALRRPGRLDRELEVRVPTVVERKDILNALFRKLPHALEAEHIEHLASATHGFVGADLYLLCAESSLAAAKRITASNENMKDEEMARTVAIIPEDAYHALHCVKPSAMREVFVEVPNVRWTHIGGQEELKLKLRQAVEWPLLYPESFKRLGIEPTRGLLMFGPPGCSKTMIAKALATESGLNFIAVKGPEVFSKWVGESERAVREVFRRARQVAPAIIFLDELDALGSARGSGSGSANVGDRVLAQLLIEMDGIVALKDVTIVAATNRPEMIDKALLRPGRLCRIVYVPLPDEPTRREILKLKFHSMPIHSEVSLEWLVDSTKGYSGAEITGVCTEAAYKALEEDVRTTTIRRHHFELALKAAPPRTTAEDIAFYENYIKKSGIVAI